jgi:hypothetical protein
MSARGLWERSRAKEGALIRVDELSSVRPDLWAQETRIRQTPTDPVGQGIRVTEAGY